MANEFIARNGIVSKSNLIVSGSLTALSTITAQTLVVQTITSSISSITGSTNFGTLSSNTHTFTGSVLTSGSIGIGTASPTYKLDVNGSGSMINIIGASSGDIATGFRIGRGSSLGAEIYDNPADNITTFNTTGGLNFRVGGSNRLTIASTGSSTFTPSSSKSLSTYTPSSWTGISDYVTSGVGWQFTRPNDGAFAHAIFTFNGTSTNNLAISSRSDLVIATGGGLGEATERLRITSDGKLKLTSTTTGGTNLDMYLLENDGLYINSNEGATARNIILQTGGTERMRIASSGQVSITSSGSTVFNLLNTAGTGNRSWRLVTNNDAAGDLTFQQSTTDQGSSYATKMLITSGGDIGIGTTSPGYKLVVDQSANNSGLFVNVSYGVTGGNAAIIANIETTAGYLALWRYGGSSKGSITTNGSSVAYNTTISDVRLKKNFEDWNENVLDLFKDIKPTLFNYLNDEDGKKKTKGYIAQQEVDKFPEAYTIDHEGYHSFNPSGMMEYTMKALKEAALRIETLEAKVIELENK